MAGITTTPGGLYEFEELDKTASGQSFCKIWDSLHSTIPLNWQYTMSDQYTMVYMVLMKGSPEIRKLNQIMLKM